MGVVPRWTARSEAGLDRAGPGETPVADAVPPARPGRDGGVPPAKDGRYVGMEPPDRRRDIGRPCDRSFAVWS